ncbi:MAG: hypothetical protein J0I20_23075 [Chloroflexi bacterium]|nr:hypothetical protein [Chloroflexota bacterium]OJV92127.1 MAG: hypothetical protein BGO39_09385 [Chloroflexi bacterium 54-19]
MDLATWWVGDPLIDLPPLLNFQIQLADDDVVLARINHLTTRQVKERRQTGHRPYIGYLGLRAVTYGWVATLEASIVKYNLVFPVPSGDRFLWDFATLPGWQGKDLYYPRLLQTIVQAEHAKRFWLVPTPQNQSSVEIISKTGFEAVGHLSLQPDGKVGLIPAKRKVPESERVLIGAALLGVPVISLPEPSGDLS